MRLINSYLESIITSLPWSAGHGSLPNSLGLGLIYYLIPYAFQAQTCVCLGSGGGFAPALMRQAQRDLSLLGSRTFLVDAILTEAGFGGPDFEGGWLAEDSLFGKHFPEITILSCLTQEAAQIFFKKNPILIDYLHVDADHSSEGVFNDVTLFLPLLKDRALITFHDAALPAVQEGIRKALGKMENPEKITLPDIGAGLTVVRLGVNRPNTKGAM